MHAIVCCVIALVLLDAVVAINIYVVSKAIPAIPANNRDNEFYRVKIAATRRLRGHIIATSTAQKETLQDEERDEVDLVAAKGLLKDMLNNYHGSLSIAEAEKILEGVFQFTSLGDEIKTMFQAAEISNQVTGSAKRWGRMDEMLQEMRQDFTTIKDNLEKGGEYEVAAQGQINKVLIKGLFLLNVIKAQRIIDIRNVPTLQQHQIRLIKEGIFSYWRKIGIKSEYLSRVLVHTEPSDINLVNWYEIEIYLSGNKAVSKSSGARSE
ncbi:RxLR-like protein [Plasmopara halstedii]|uniref:RxLR-like protein n=1 Tax=Plasmopara halstedii TaxID=4781 RepID=A0A0P1AU10_PLAHL|nr:RxLR-like protein [Plasmopara halstedii]CEG45716.1 RxLR-like protein [Plasmopara halstedii]|eukprot:XP_024582085.1 RxLR-like protein [Plasmopara halstedii]